MKNFFFLITYVLLLTGCGPQSGAKLDSDDEKDARVRSGLERVQQKDWNRAVKQFEAALEKNPKLARPDLELALIYHQQKKNYVRAVYHYERYLEKRPSTEKLHLIENWIRQAKVSLAGEMDGIGNAVSEELIRLTRENNLLRKQLETVQNPLPAKSVHVKTILSEPPARIEPPPVDEPPASKPSTPLPTTPVHTYQVRPGDTLMRIAGAVYGDTGRWRSIYEANREQLKSESDIKVGQTLILPPISDTLKKE